MSAKQPGKVGVAGVPRVEEDILSIRGPAHGSVTGRLPGEPPGHATFCAHYVYIVKFVLTGRVGDPGAIRRKIGSVHDRIDGSKAPGFAALTGNGPHIIGVEKGNLIRTERGIAQKQRGSRLGETLQNETGQNDGAGERVAKGDNPSSHGRALGK
jgi:hypothetical protein